LLLQIPEKRKKLPVFSIQGRALLLPSFEKFFLAGQILAQFGGYGS